VTVTRARTLTEFLAEQPRDGIDLAPLLADIEQRLFAQVESSDPFAARAARYLAGAGGKRFRPMLLGLVAHLGDGADPRIPDAGVVVELVHLATLYHDDVIDEASVRRGAVAANTRWGNTIAILTGDFLFARASELSAELGVEVTRIMARTIATLCEGQIREVQGTRSALPPDVPPLTPDFEHYLSVVADKTAALISTSCRLGALLARCSPELVEALAGYGTDVGMAFQLSDDILDVTSEPELLGKLPGTDLREGVRTLPVLFALEDDPEGELAALLDRPVLTDEGVRRAIALLRTSPAIERARAATRDYAEAAVAALAGIPDGAPARTLRELAEFTVTRAN